MSGTAHDVDGSRLPATDIRADVVGRAVLASEGLTFETLATGLKTERVQRGWRTVKTIETHDFDAIAIGPGTVAVAHATLKLADKVLAFTGNPSRDAPDRTYVMISGTAPPETTLSALIGRRLRDVLGDAMFASEALRELGDALVTETDMDDSADSKAPTLYLDIAPAYGHLASTLREKAA